MYGKKLKQMRLALGLTQAEFAQKLNISSPALSKIESDQTKPSADTTAKLINTFGINLNWLYNDQGGMFNHEGATQLSEQAEAPYQGRQNQNNQDYTLLLKLSDTQEKLIEQIEENKRLRQMFYARLQQLDSATEDNSQLRDLIRKALLDFGREDNEG